MINCNKIDRYTSHWFQDGKPRWKTLSLYYLWPRPVFECFFLVQRPRGLKGSDYFRNTFKGGVGANTKMKVGELYNLGHEVFKRGDA